MKLNLIHSEKALAATGYQSPQLAAEWLLHHVNDPTIDDNQPREYILYLCPKGQLLEQIETYYAESQNKTGWNGAHNYLPHITLCSFFQVISGSANDVRLIQSVNCNLIRLPMKLLVFLSMPYSIAWKR